MRLVTHAILALALLWSGPAALAAPEDDPAAASPLRLYHVGALTMGRNDFLARTLGITMGERSEESPLFGGEGEEPWLPVGNVEEVLELIRFQVAPASWDSVAGALLRTAGSDVLVVRQEATALDGVGAALFAMEQRWLKPITLDVAAVRLPAASSTPSATELDALAQGEALEAAVTLTVFPGQLACAFAGREVAYLHDYDVVVAMKAKISDPIVDVLNLGLQVGARASVSDGDDRVRLQLNAHLAHLLRMDQAPAGESRSLETPVITSTSVQTTAELVPGAWTLLEGALPRGEASHVVFLVRARVGTRVSAAASKGVSLPTLESAGMTKLKDRAFSTQSLTTPIQSTRGPSLSLSPSNFTAPEPPELREPRAALSEEPLLELLREAIAPESWGSRGGTAEMKKGTLYVRAPEPAVVAVERLLQALEQALLWSVSIEARLVDLPASSALLAGPVLAPEADTALAQALKDGTATLLEGVRVSSLAGQRSHVAALEERSYVMDYDVEIAEDAVISNPSMHRLRSGAVLDIAPQLTSTRDSVVATVRFTRSVPAQALRSVRSAVGDIQCPDQRVHELKADVELPVGRTTLAASWAGPAGRRTALFLTARVNTRTAR